MLYLKNIIFFVGVLFIFSIALYNLHCGIDSGFLYLSCFLYLCTGILPNKNLDWFLFLLSLSSVYYWVYISF